MKIRVIEVIIDGKSSYLKGQPSIFNNCLTDSPLEAINFLAEPERPAYISRDSQYDANVAIERVINDLYLKGDSYYGKSSLRCDEVNVVEFEVEYVLMSSRIGRHPHK